jgi:uncharacterized YccA/Bax inhibitor family protein
MASPSHNPVLARAGFDTQVQVAGPTMNLFGTMTKTFLLLGIAATGTLIWLYMEVLRLPRKLRG